MITVNQFELSLKDPQTSGQFPVCLIITLLGHSHY